MPVQVIWDDEAQTILRQVYAGHVKLTDYIAATDEFKRMAETMPHTVHSVMDRTQILSTPSVMLPALRYANTHVASNLGLRVIIKAGMFTRFFVDMGRRVAPHLVKNVHFVDTLDEARTIIASQTQTISTS